MSIEQNKAIVRRFVEEVLAGGNVELVDELLSPDYVNRGMGGMGRADFKAWLGANSAGPGGQMDIVDLVAEGDAVVARFNYAITLPNGDPIECSRHDVLPPRRRQDRGGRPDHLARPDAGVCRPDAGADGLTGAAVEGRAASGVRGLASRATRPAPSTPERPASSAASPPG